MIERIFKRVLSSYDHRFVSRRLILIVDLAIAAFSFVMACLLRFNFNFSGIDKLFYGYYLLFLLLIRYLCFRSFRSYHGIVRHASLEDVTLIFRTVTTSTLIISLCSIGATLLFQNTTFYIPTSILAIEYFICLFMMIASRFFVKSIYMDMMHRNQHKQTKKYVIYGAGELGLLTRKVLLKNTDQNIRILCFIDENETLHGNSVEGVRIYSLHDAYEKFIAKANDIEVVLAIGQISSFRKKEIGDFFLKHHIIIQVVPSASEWLNNRLSSDQIRKIEIEDLLEREAIRIDNIKIGEGIHKKVTLVTGAAGSIGSEIAAKVLANRPAKLILIDQSESGLYDLEFELRQKYKTADVKTEICIVLADITDVHRMSDLFQLHRPEIIFHAAGYKHVPMMEMHPYEAVRVNVHGTKLLADLAKRHGASKFVFVSTDKVINPTNVMGATKRLAEMYLQGLNDFKLDATRFIITRFGNVLGSNGSVVPLFKKQILAGGPVTVTHPEVIRYFMTIPEACSLVLEAQAMGQGGEIFVFDMGKPVRIDDLARRMIQLSGFIPDKHIKIEYSGLRPGEKLYEELLGRLEENLPTYHPKILKAKQQPFDTALVEETVLSMEESLKAGNNDALVIGLKRVIPEYISNNSEYQRLDFQADKI